MQIDKTVFISYRRTNVYVARAVHANLTAHGFDAFLDFESIDAGAFEKIILRQIEARAHFVLVLTPSALERCMDADDLLRREIEHAIALKRNIVPLMFENFDFNDVKSCLIGSLIQLPKYNGIRMPADFFEEAMNRLRERFLSKPLDVILHPIQPSETAAVDAQLEPVQPAPLPSSAQLQSEELFERGFTRYNQGAFGVAVDFYSEAIALDPQLFEAYFRRGLAYRAMSVTQSAPALIDKAKVDFEQAIGLAANDPKVSIIRSLLLLNDGDLDGALSEAEKGVKDNPGYFDAFYARACVHRRRGDNERAIADYTEGIRLVAYPFVPYHDRGMAKKAKGDYEGAIADLTQALEINPDSDLAYCNRGIVRAGDDNKGAMDDLDHALSLNPMKVDSWLMRGVLHLSMGDHARGLDDVQAALRIDPEHELGKQILRKAKVQKGIDTVFSIFGSKK